MAERSQMGALEREEDSAEFACFILGAWEGVCSLFPIPLTVGTNERRVLQGFPLQHLSRLHLQLFIKRNSVSTFPLPHCVLGGGRLDG